MRRMCGDCPVCNDVDANDTNVDGVKDVNVVDPSTITDWEEVKLLKNIKIYLIYFLLFILLFTRCISSSTFS